MHLTAPYAFSAFGHESHVHQTHSECNIDQPDILGWAVFLLNNNYYTYSIGCYCITCSD